MGMEMARGILGSALFALKLPVALARTPDKLPLGVEGG
jgi:hypothetical protein